MRSAIVGAETRAWVERAVVGLNLCPFARAPHAAGRIRYVVTEAGDPEALLASLLDELGIISRAPAATLETTLLIHPRVLADFVDYNDFLDVADAAVARLGLEGTIQVASFHPQYRFAGSAPDDPGNATNRSPYPMLQLLREASVARALTAMPDTAAISAANVRTLRRLGVAGWSALRRQCSDDADAAAPDESDAAKARQSSP